MAGQSDQEESHAHIATRVARRRRARGGGAASARQAPRSTAASSTPAATSTNGERPDRRLSRRLPLARGRRRWNQSGPAGPAGPAGATGATGRASRTGRPRRRRERRATPEPPGPPVLLAPPGRPDLRAPPVLQAPPDRQAQRARKDRRAIPARFGRRTHRARRPRRPRLHPTARSAGTIDLTYDASHHAVLTCVGSAVAVAEGRRHDRPDPRQRGDDRQRRGRAADEFVELVQRGLDRARDRRLEDRLPLRGRARATRRSSRSPTERRSPRARSTSRAAPATPARATADVELLDRARRHRRRVGVKDGTGAVLDSVGYGTATNALVEGTRRGAVRPARASSARPDGDDTNANAADFTDHDDADAEGDERLGRTGA